MSISDALRRGILLTPLEAQVFESEYIRKVQEHPFVAARCGEYLLKVYERIRKIEQNCNVWRQGHVVLLRMALDLDENSLDKILQSSHLWLSAVNFGQAGAPFVNRYFIAIKLLIGVPERVVVAEEVRHHLDVTRLWHCRVCGYEWESRGQAICPRCESKDAKNLPIGAKEIKQAEVAAHKRVQRARDLAKILCLYFIRGFAKEVTEKAVPADASYWVRVK